VLIKPDVGYSVPYLCYDHRRLIASIIDGIRRVSDADIVVLDGQGPANRSS